MAGKLVYKNISDQDQAVIGVGEVPAGETVEVDNPIENPNFELQTKSDKTEAKVGIIPPAKPVEEKREDK